MNPWSRFQPVDLLLLLTLFLSPVTVSGQEWVARLSLPAGSQGHTVAIDANETTTFIAGSILGTQGNWDVVLAAMEKSGDTLWVHQWDLGADERAVGLLADNDGGVILALTRWDDTGPTACLARWSGNGSAHWHRVFTDGPNRTSAVAISQLASGAFVLTFASDGRNGNRCGLSSVTMDGDEHWTVFTPQVQPRCLATSVDAIAVGGWNPDVPQQAPLLLYDTDGTLKVRDEYSGAGNGRTLPVWLRHGSDGFYLGGHAIGEDGSGMPFVLHYSEEGTRRWTVLPFTSAGRHRLVDLQPFPGGGVALTARKETSAGNFDIHLARLTANGGAVWEQSFDRTGGSLDRHAPLFGGVLTASLHGDSAYLYWDCGRDDVTSEDDMMYELYLASASGGQDFTTPSLHITGATNLKLGNLPPGRRTYIVVRAVDEAGNRDTNIREVVVETGGEPFRSSFQRSGDSVLSHILITECFLTLQHWSAIPVVRQTK
ncbi:MAG: hypothetical protein KFF77_01315 [Bacteroidetes bacterium]|nr:hypothetical protein [Bacteroidota bacterium]